MSKHLIIKSAYEEPSVRVKKVKRIRKPRVPKTGVAEQGEGEMSSTPVMKSECFVCGDKHTIKVAWKQDGEIRKGIRNCPACNANGMAIAKSAKVISMAAYKAKKAMPEILRNTAQHFNIAKRHGYKLTGTGANSVSMEHEDEPQNKLTLTHTGWVHNGGHAEITGKGHKALNAYLNGAHDHDIKV